MEEPVSNFGKPKGPDNKQKSFIELIERTLQDKGDNIPTVKYDLPYPKEEFLEFIVANKNVLLHGSPHGDVGIMEPRQANDSIRK